MSWASAEKNRHKWTYPDLPSARRPAPVSDLEIFLPFRKLPQLSNDESCLISQKVAKGKERGGATDSDFQTNLRSERVDNSSCVVRTTT